MTSVTCPTVRYHPAVVAQKAATVQLLSQGRFRLGLGSGENLNEHAVGGGWPSIEVRPEMLEEAIGGACGVTRASLPPGHAHTARLDHGVGRLALPTEAPPSSDCVVFGTHPHGFAAHMARSPRVTRYWDSFAVHRASARW